MGWAPSLVDAVPSVLAAWSLKAGLKALEMRRR